MSKFSHPVRRPVEPVHDGVAVAKPRSVRPAGNGIDAFRPADAPPELRTAVRLVLWSLAVGAGDVRLVLGGASLARPVVEPICVVYDEVFSAPPFFWRDDESVLHRDRLVGLLDDPSFGVALAYDCDRLVGFAYGFTLAADTRRWSLVTPPVPEETATEWPGRTFMLFDFAVGAPYRGHGVGRRLHDGLLTARGEQRATLTVQPSAVDTKAVYQRWGWRMVGQMEGGAMAAAPRFDVYLRDRLDDLRTRRR